MQSLGSTSARIRAATASWPPDELVPRARASGAGRRARLQVPDHRALSRACCAPPRRQPAACYGSRLWRRSTVTVSDGRVENYVQPSTGARAAAVGTLKLSRRHSLAHRSTEPEASTAARRARITAVAQQLRSKTRRDERAAGVYRHMNVHKTHRRSCTSSLALACVTYVAAAAAPQPCTQQHSTAQRLRLPRCARRPR
jgi:hypothetical protein